MTRWHGCDAGFFDALEGHAEFADGKLVLTRVGLILCRHRQAKGFFKLLRLLSDACEAHPEEFDGISAATSEQSLRRDITVDAFLVLAESFDGLVHQARL